MNSLTKTEQAKGGVKLYGIQQKRNGAWTWIDSFWFSDTLVYFGQGNPNQMGEKCPSMTTERYSEAEQWQALIQSHDHLRSRGETRIWRWQGQREVEA